MSIQVTDSTNGAQLHPLLDKLITQAANNQHEYEKCFTGIEFYLADHKIQETPVLPGVVYLEMAYAAAMQAYPNSLIKKLSGVIWVSPIKVNAPKTVTIYLSGNHPNILFEIKSITEEQKFLLHARGKIALDAAEPITIPILDILRIKDSLSQHLADEEIYQSFFRCGLNYGPSFHVIKECWLNQTEAISYLQAHANIKNQPNDFRLHPSMLDGAIQTALCLLSYLSGTSSLYLPFGLGQLEIIQIPTPINNYFAYATLRPNSTIESTATLDIKLVNKAGEVFLYFKNFTAKRIQQK